MGLTPFEYIMSAATIASSVFGAASQHQANKTNIAGAEEAQKTATKQAQVNAEKPPEQSIEVAKSEAQKKKTTSFGIQDSLIAQANNNNTIGQKEVWG